MLRLLDVLTFGPARRRREMDRLAQALARVDVPVGGHPLDDTLWRGSTRTPVARSWSATPRRTGWRARRARPGSDRRDRQTVAIVALVATVLCGLLGPRFIADHRVPLSAARDRPPAGAGEAEHRLLPAVVPPPGTGGYELQVPAGEGGEARWDPCRTIHLVVNGTAPVGSQDVITDAVAAVSAATGLAFTYDGTTDESPSKDRAPYQPDRYGKTWAPLLVSWTTPQVVPDLGGPIIGLGGGRRVSVGGPAGTRTAIVTGEVDLDRPQFVQDLAQYARTHDERIKAGLVLVVVHELGHVMGLGHVADPRQVMFAEGSLEVTALGDGDRRGLAAMGAGPCIKQL